MTINTTVMRAINTVRALLGKSAISGNLDIDSVYFRLTGTTQTGDKIVIGDYTFLGLATGAHKDEEIVINENVTDALASADISVIRGELTLPTTGKWTINGVDYGQSTLMSNVIVMLMSADEIPSDVAVSYDITITE